MTLASPLPARSQARDALGVTALLEATLDRLAGREADGHEPTIGALLDALDERGFGLLLLLFALPCCVPILYGVPQVVALPMLALAYQIARGREAPWLPDALTERRFDPAAMRRVVARLRRALGWAERLARPRLVRLTEGAGLRLVGLLLLIPTASILVPLPSTNTAPGIGVAVASVGLLERDGLLVALGLAFGLAWVLFLVLITAFLGAEALSIVKDALLGSAAG